MAIKLIIVGLRRSGTTIYWETFRQDDRLLCYDEPFNRYLRVLPAPTGLKAPEEFIRLVNRDAASFWNKFSPIHYGEELSEGLSDAQRAYLEYLGDSGERVALDSTRWNRTAAAKKLGMTFRSLRYRLKKLGLDEDNSS